MTNALVNRTDVEIMEEFGRRLKGYRLQQNIAVSDLAERAGLSRTTVANAEAGRTPRLDTIIRILRVLRRLDALDAFLPPPAESPIQALAKASRVTSTRKARVGRFAHSPPPGAPVIPAGGMREVIEDQKRERPDKDSHG